MFLSHNGAPSDCAGCRSVFVFSCPLPHRGCPHPLHPTSLPERTDLIAEAKGGLPHIRRLSRLSWWWVLPRRAHGLLV